MSCTVNGVSVCMKCTQTTKSLQRDPNPASIHQSRVWDTALAKGQAVMHSLLPISCHQTIKQSLINSICSVSFPGLFDWIEVQPIRSLQQKQLWGGVGSQALKEWATFSAPGHDDDAQTINSNMEVIIERERESEHAHGGYETNYNCYLWRPF